MSRHGPASRRSVVGLLLLASMLFYVSGAALGLHLQLSHTHAAPAEAPVDAGHDGEHSPTDTPAKRPCAICDMLAGINKPVAIVVQIQPLFFTAEAGALPVAVEVCIDHFQTPDISRRGPPAAC